MIDMEEKKSNNRDKVVLKDEQASIDVPEKPKKNQNIPSSSNHTQDNPDTTANVNESPPSLHFKCELCNLDEVYEYFGKSPPWGTRTCLLENAYVMRDPFSAFHKKQILILGAKCSLCEIDVCVGSTCSLFFSKRFCKNCAFKNKTYFPTQVQMKINKNFVC